MDGNRKCGRPHHYLLHGSGNIYCQAHQASHGGTHQHQETILLEILNVPVQTGKGTNEDALVFVDPGSTINFIRNKFARKLGLKGEPVFYYLRVVDSHYREMHTLMYNLALVLVYAILQ